MDLTQKINQSAAKAEKPKAEVSQPPERPKPPELDAEDASKAVAQLKAHIEELGVFEEQLKNHQSQIDHSSQQQLQVDQFNGRWNSYLEENKDATKDHMTDLSKYYQKGYDPQDALKIVQKDTDSKKQADAKDKEDQASALRPSEFGMQVQPQFEEGDDNKTQMRKTIAAIEETVGIEIPDFRVTKAA